MTGSDPGLVADIEAERRRARQAGDEGRLAELDEMQAALLTARGDETEARTALARAVEHRTRAGQDGPAAKARYGLALLDSRLADGAARAHRGFEEALAGFREVGDDTMTGRCLLRLAGVQVAAGDLEQARAGAEEARQIALAATDHILYLQACVQLAGIAEQEGDRTAQLTILFTCQASLADLLGDEARTPVLHLIDGLRQQWGDAEFDRQMARYRAQFEGPPP